MNVLTQSRELIRWPLGHDEARAVDTDEQGKRSVDDALRPLVRARTGEFLERAMKVRKFLHYAETEANR